MVAGSNPVSVAKNLKPLSGKSNPDSGFLLSETGNCQEVTESAPDDTGRKSTNIGSGTSETGTANPLHNHCESTDKSTALIPATVTATKSPKNKGETADR